MVTQYMNSSALTRFSASSHIYGLFRGIAVVVILSVSGALHAANAAPISQQKLHELLRLIGESYFAGRWQCGDNLNDAFWLLPPPQGVNWDFSVIHSATVGLVSTQNAYGVRLADLDASRITIDGRVGCENNRDAPVVSLFGVTVETKAGKRMQHSISEANSHWDNAARKFVPDTPAEREAAPVVTLQILFNNPEAANQFATTLSATLEPGSSSSRSGNSRTEEISRQKNESEANNLQTIVKSLVYLVGNGSNYGQAIRFEFWRKAHHFERTVRDAHVKTDESNCKIFYDEIIVEVHDGGDPEQQQSSMTVDLRKVSRATEEPDTQGDHDMEWKSAPTFSVWVSEAPNKLSVLRYNFEDQAKKVAAAFNQSAALCKNL